LSILSEQCLNRPIPDETSLKVELEAWQKARNSQASALTV
jgi:hypothetical protein